MWTTVWSQTVNALNRASQHSGETDVAGEWNLHPSIVLGVALLVGAYLYWTALARRHHRSVEGTSYSQMFLFLLGSLVLFLSLASPLDTLSDYYLLSAHMVQHILLAVVVPMLWLLGTPGWLIRPLANLGWATQAVRFLTSPVTAFLVFNLNFWAWHLPVLYEFALADEGIHVLQHLTFISTGVLNWWPVLSPLPGPSRLSYPKQLLYLAANCQPGVVLGAILVFSHAALYQAYVKAPRIFDISTQTDQQLAGLIMWIPGNAPYLAVLSFLFLRWSQQEE